MRLISLSIWAFLLLNGKFQICLSKPPVNVPISGIWTEEGCIVPVDQSDEKGRKLWGVATVWLFDDPADPCLTPCGCPPEKLVASPVASGQTNGSIVNTNSSGGLLNVIGEIIRFPVGGPLHVGFPQGNLLPPPVPLHNSIPPFGLPAPLTPPFGLPVGFPAPFGSPVPVSPPFSIPVQAPPPFGLPILSTPPSGTTPCTTGKPFLPPPPIGHALPPLPIGPSIPINSPPLPLIGPSIPIYSSSPPPTKPSIPKYSPPTDIGLGSKPIVVPIDLGYIPVPAMVEIDFGYGLPPPAQVPIDFGYSPVFSPSGAGQVAASVGSTSITEEESDKTSLAASLNKEKNKSKVTTVNSGIVGVQTAPSSLIAPVAAVGTGSVTSVTEEESDKTSLAASLNKEKNKSKVTTVTGGIVGVQTAPSSLIAPAAAVGTGSVTTISEEENEKANMNVNYDKDNTKKKTITTTGGTLITAPPPCICEPDQQPVVQQLGSTTVTEEESEKNKLALNYDSEKRKKTNTAVTNFGAAAGTDLTGQYGAPISHGTNPFVLSSSLPPLLPPPGAIYPPLIVPPVPFLPPLPLPNNGLSPPVDFPPLLPPNMFVVPNSFPPFPPQYNGLPPPNMLAVPNGFPLSPPPTHIPHYPPPIPTELKRGKPGQVFPSPPIVYRKTQNNFLPKVPQPTLPVNNGPVAIDFGNLPPSDGSIKSVVEPKPIVSPIALSPSGYSQQGSQLNPSIVPVDFGNGLPSGSSVSPAGYDIPQVNAPLPPSNGNEELPVQNGNRNILVNRYGGIVASRSARHSRRNVPKCKEGRDLKSNNVDGTASMPKDSTAQPNQLIATVSEGLNFSLPTSHVNKTEQPQPISKDLPHPSQTTSIEFPPPQQLNSTKPTELLSPLHLSDSVLSSKLENSNITSTVNPIPEVETQSYKAPVITAASTIPVNEVIAAPGGPVTSLESPEQGNLIKVIRFQGKITPYDPFGKPLCKSCLLAENLPPRFTLTM